MTGKHYQWHKRWAVDLARLRATHDSGLVVEGTVGAGERDYRPINLEAWQTQMLTRMPLPALVPHARRLMQEAARVLDRARDLAGRISDDA